MPPERDSISMAVREKEDKDVFTLCPETDVSSRLYGDLVGYTTRLALGRCVQDPVRVYSESVHRTEHWNQCN